MKKATKEKIIYYDLTFRLDRDTSDHLDSLASMFPYVASRTVIVRELINSAYDQAIKEGLIRSE